MRIFEDSDICKCQKPVFFYLSMHQVQEGEMFGRKNLFIAAGCDRGNRHETDGRWH